MSDKIMSDKITKLSQAIRLGATFRPQCFYALSKGDDTNGMTCAIGAAYEVHLGEFPLPLKGISASEVTSFVKRFFDGDDMKALTINNKIAKLNDGQHLTREEIADWLESIGM